MSEQKTYSLNQAAEVTGCSLGRFRYNKDRLVELGAVVTDEGWTIPEQALVELGWFDPSKPVKRKLTKTEKMEKEIAELRAENKKLREQLREAEEKKKPSLFGFRRKG